MFAAVLDGRPYPAPQLTGRDWAAIPPRQVRLCDLTTTKTELRLDVLLARPASTEPLVTALERGEIAPGSRIR